MHRNFVSSTNVRDSERYSHIIPIFCWYLCHLGLLACDEGSRKAEVLVTRAARCQDSGAAVSREP